jgi:2-dehydro-3-deoxygluconokinase
MRPPHVVTIGETMALLDSTSMGPLQHARTLTVGIAGSESNVAIALRRLGTDTTWIGKVGNDPLGDLIVREISAEGVRVIASRDPVAPTALMIKEHRTSTDTHVWYYRTSNAGSHLRAEEVDQNIIAEADLLHVTGISLALSPDMAEMVHEAVRIAKLAGTLVSFDLNFRSKLWSADDAAAAYRRIIPLSDLVFAGDDEAAIAVGAAPTPAVLAQRLVDLGAGEAIIKLGHLGAIAIAGGREYVRAAVPITPLDTVGAGDAFVAGYLADRLLGEPTETCLTTAVTAGAYACLVNGDWEGTPRREELALLNARDPVRR